MIRTLGELIDALEPLKRDTDIQYDFAYFRPSGIHSYRGYYNQVAIDYTDKPGDTTVQELLDLCNRGLTETFEGWKGGDYEYDRSTNIWIAEPRESCNVVIKKIKDFGYKYVICTKMLEV